MDINVTDIILSLVLTISLYLGLPLLFYRALKKPTTSKKVKRLVIINAVCWWLFFRVINPGSTGAAAFLWSGIAYAILEKRREKEEQAENPQEESIEIAEQEVVQPEIKEANPRNQVYATSGSASAVDSRELPVCGNCGAQLLSDSVYCSKCGTKVKPAAKKSTTKILLTVLIMLVVVIASPFVYSKILLPKMTYAKAEELFNQANYSEAHKIYKELGNYDDAKDKAKECLYNQATALRNEKKWDKANAIFEKIKGYKDSDDLIHHHNYIEIASLEPTCETAGYKDLKCDGCGETLHTDFEATGHGYSGETCTEPKKCFICGVTSGSPLGHTNSAKCSRCGTMLFTTLTYSGRGYKTFRDINLPKGNYIVTGKAVMTGGYAGSFYVYLKYPSGNNAAYWIEGLYSSQTSMEKMAPVSGPINGGFLEINAGDNVSWTITIEAVA